MKYLQALKDVNFIKIKKGLGLLTQRPTPSLLTIAAILFLVFLPGYINVLNLNKISFLLLIPFTPLFLVIWFTSPKPNRGLVLTLFGILLSIILFFFQSAHDATNAINTIQAANVYNCSVAKSIVKKFEEGKNLSNLDIRTKYKIEPYEDINNILLYYGQHAATNTLEKSSSMEVANNLIERVWNLVLIEQTSGPSASISANLTKSDYNATIRDISKDIERFICEEFRYSEPRLNVKHREISLWLYDQFDRLLRTMKLK